MPRLLSKDEAMSALQQAYSCRKNLTETTATKVVVMYAVYNYKGEVVAKYPFSQKDQAESKAVELSSKPIKGKLFDHYVGRVKESVHE